MKHDRVSKVGLNITLDPKKPHQRSSGCVRRDLEMSLQTALRHDFTQIPIGFSLPGFDKTGLIFHSIMEMLQNF